MQSTPLLLRQLLRSSFSGVKSTLPLRPIPSQKLSILRRPLSPVPTCLRRGFRAQICFHSDGKPPPTPQTDDKNASTSVSEPSGSINSPQNESASPQHSERQPNASRDELPSQEEGRRSQYAKRFSHLMDNVQANVFIAGQRINDLTGYSGIETLKNDIEEQETVLRSHRNRLRAAKTAYTEAIALRSSSQREVNSLLQRKNAWTPQDLERFTALYRSDHANEQAETAASSAVSAAEKEAEEAATKLSRTILARYHEEQIWSDKIRRMSTWGTWGLMGMNVLLFLVFQVLVEPWRRKRLVRGFEEKVVEALERDKVVILQHGDGSRVQQVEASTSQTALPPDANSRATTASTGAAVTFVSIDPRPVATIETPPGKGVEEPLEGRPPLPTTSNPPPILETYKEIAQGLFSEREVSMTHREVTTVALEGAAAGAAVVGLLVVLLRPK